VRNPFVVGEAAGGPQFAGREEEVERIASALGRAGATLVVYGDRRLGKSAALEQAAVEARRRGIPVAVASLATATSPAEAAQRVLAALQRELGAEGPATIERIAHALDLSVELLAPTPSAGRDATPAATAGVAKAASRGRGAGQQQLLPGFYTTPPVPPNPRFAFLPQPGRPATRLLPDLLDAIDADFAARGRVVGIALDEFQRIHEWGGGAAGWALRDSLQRHQSVGYVLLGSQPWVIDSLVGEPEGSLWGVADLLRFGPLPAHVLAGWITQQGARTGITIPAEAARLVVRLTHPRTRDVVQLARAVWFDRCTRGFMDSQLLVQEAFERTVREQGALFDLLWSRLDAREQGVLRAFAANEAVQITSAETIRRFRLGPKSSVYSTVERLVEAEHLARRGTGRYAFDDPYFRRYVQVCALPDIGETPPPLLPSFAARRVQGDALPGTRGK